MPLTAAEPVVDTVRQSRSPAGLTPLLPGVATNATDVVVLESRGAALIVGDDASVVRHAAALAPTLRVVVCAPGAENVTGAPAGVTVVGGRVVSVAGHLGAFTVHAAAGSDGTADLGPFGPNTDRKFDLVLDLSLQPHIKHAVAPLGYFAAGNDPEAITAATTAMRALVGRFTKPRHFDYAPELCAHGAQGKAGCTRCLEVCDAAAIRSVGDIIAVDPALCQGCAACSLACPTGAITSRQAPRPALLRTIAETIAAARQQGVASPVLVVHSAGAAEVVGALGLPAYARTIKVPALAAFGEELWFSALAQGASAVVLADDDGQSPKTRTLLGAQIGIATMLAAAVGATRYRIALAPLASLPEAVRTGIGPGGDWPAQVAVPEPRPRKRALLLASLDAIAAVPAHSTVAVPPEAALGTIVVDRARCTLCHACVNLCPTSALVASHGPVPALSFVEAQCVQCGICVNGCPEAAMALEARFAPDASLRNSGRVLCEDTLAACTDCGTPFIGVRLLASSLDKMHNFPGLADAGGVDRLRMCPACRQRRAMDAGSGN
jgi:ferredoxin